MIKSCCVICLFLSLNEKQTFRLRFRFPSLSLSLSPKYVCVCSYFNNDRSLHCNVYIYPVVQFLCLCKPCMSLIILFFKKKALKFLITINLPTRFQHEISLNVCASKNKTLHTQNHHHFGHYATNPPPSPTYTHTHTHTHSY